MKRRRVLVWHWGRRGGGPLYTWEMARALAARPDVDVHLSLSRQAEIYPRFQELGLPEFPVDTYTGVVSAVVASSRLPWLRRRFERYLREHRIDTVLCTMGHVWNWAVVPAIRAAGARYCLTLHDARQHPGEENPVHAWTIRRDIASADGIITLTHHVREQFLAGARFPAARCWTIPHGVFRFEGGERPCRTEEPSAVRPFRLLFFGRILAYKGLDLLLAAYPLLRQRFGAGITLCIAGAGDLAPYAQALAGLEGVDVENRWIGEEEVGHFLSRADLVILPYREASQSGVAAAAYGAGLPVVGTPVGGLAEQIVHETTGLIADAVSPEAVAGAITRLVEDQALYRACVAGAAVAAGGLDWAVIAGSVVEALDHLAHDAS